MQDLHPLTTEQTRQLMQVALGEAEADLAIVNGAIVNVYTGEVLTGDTVLIKGERIAYVGKNTQKSIGANTQVIDAVGKTLIPGLIDGHTHTDYPYAPPELIKYAIKGATTSLITEVAELAFPMGVAGVTEFMRWVKNQPIKFYVVIPPMETISPIAREHSVTPQQLRRLLRRRDVAGLGESYWFPAVEGNTPVVDLIAETKRSGKKLDGHTAGARGNKLQAYVSLGITSDHEPTTADEVMERLRLGLFVILREGEIRRELQEVIGKLKDEKIDFKRLAMATDGLGPWQFTRDGCVDFLVQKVIDLGMEPVTAIQMATLNVAQRFSLDDFIGGIAPGRYADIVIIPNLNTIKAEYVISNGKVVARNGDVLVAPRKVNYSKSIRNSLRLGKQFTAGDFAIAVSGNREKAKVRVIDQVTNLVCREAILDLPVSGGSVQADNSQNVIRLAAIERSYAPGKTFTGFIRGIGLKRGAIATSITWDTCDLIVAGASDADMALAVNRLGELQGGIVVCDNGKVLAELALPIGGMISPQPMDVLSQKLYDIQHTVENMGCNRPDIRLTLCVLTSGAIPFLRICESGLFDVKENRFVDLLVD